MRRRLVLLAALPLLFGTLLFVGSTRAPSGEWRAFEPDGTLIDDCIDTDALENLPCLRQSYANLAWSDGAAAAMRALWINESRQEQTLLWCHRIAHLIGEAIWTRADGDLTRAIPEISADFEEEPEAIAFFLKAGDCVDGLFHGLLERELAERPEPTSAIDDLATLCADSEIWDDDEKISALRCVHGIGHGAMIVTNNRLADALALCDRTGSVADDWPGLCASGVFMEYAAPTVAGGSLVDPADPFRDCVSLVERYSTQCYLHAAREAIEEIPETAGLVELCGRIGSLPGRSACSFEVGSALFERTIGLAPSAFVDLVAAACPAMAPHFISCLNGALEDASRGSDPLLSVVERCEQFPAALRYPCGIIAEVRRDWREISPSGCEAIADPRVRAGCEWSRERNFFPPVESDPPLPLD